MNWLIFLELTKEYIIFSDEKSESILLSILLYKNEYHFNLIKPKNNVEFTKFQNNLDINNHNIKKPNSKIIDNY